MPPAWTEVKSVTKAKLPKAVLGGIDHAKVALLPFRLKQLHDAGGALLCA
jgi:hypothetical protein